MVLVVLSLRKEEMEAKRAYFLSLSQSDGPCGQLFQGTADCLRECGGRAPFPVSPVPLFYSQLGLRLYDGN